jgi:hypothetical protein
LIREQNAGVNFGDISSRTMQSNFRGGLGGTTLLGISTSNNEPSIGGGYVRKI